MSTLAALALSGCAATSPAFDSEFGASVRTTLASQVVHPAAARNGNPVSGIDGRAARAAQERYEKSFAQPQTNAETLTLVRTK